jgi:tetratricopeptide (TPR) repeat protein
MNYRFLVSSLSLTLLLQTSTVFLLSSCSVPSLLQQSSSNIPEQFKDQENLSGIAKTIRDKAEQFTVRIDYPNGNGSGVIVAKNGNTYYVLTAQHVVENAEEYEIVTPDDKKYKVDGSNITTKGSADLAVVQFQSDETYQVATLADYKTEFEEDQEKQQQEMEKQQQEIKKQLEEIKKQTEETTAQIKSSGVNLESMLQETTSQVEDFKKRLEERTGKSFEEIQENLPQESTGQVEDFKKHSEEKAAKSTSSGEITQIIEDMEQKSRKKMQEKTQKYLENSNKQLKKLQNPQYLSQWLFLLGWSRFNDSPSLSLSAGKDRTMRMPGMVQKGQVYFVSNAFDTLASKKRYELGYTNFSQGGMSGGAVLDTKGRVVGIHAAAEGERIGLGEIQLGGSFGLPIKAFLPVANQMGIKSEWLKVEKFRPQRITEADKQSIAKNLFELEPPGRNSTEIDWFNYGNNLMRIQRPQEAIAAFDEAIKIKPDFYQAYYA